MSKAASAVALRKGLWRDKQGFSPPRKAGQEGVRLYVEGGNPRRTPLIGKIAIYGWTLLSILWGLY